MQLEILDVKFDMSKMTLEDLQKLRKEARQVLANVEHQLLLRKMANHKQSSN